HHCFDRDLIAWTRFSNISASSFESSCAPLRSHVEIQINALDSWGGVRILEDASEVVTQIEGCQHRARRDVARAEHVVHVYRGESVQRDVAIHAVGDLVTVLIL